MTPTSSLRRLLGLALAAAGLLTFVPTGFAQPGRKVSIDKDGVHVGFPTRGIFSGFKTGAWAPVYVQLTAHAPVSRADGDLVVETTDSDDMENSYTADLPPMDKG